MTRYHVTMFDPFTNSCRTLVITAPDRAAAGERAAALHPEWDRRITRRAP